MVKKALRKPETKWRPLVQHKIWDNVITRAASPPSHWRYTQTHKKKQGWRHYGPMRARDLGHPPSRVALAESRWKLVSRKITKRNFFPPYVHRVNEKQKSRQVSRHFSTLRRLFWDVRPHPSPPTRPSKKKGEEEKNRLVFATDEWKGVEKRLSTPFRRLVVKPGCHRPFKSVLARILLFFFPFRNEFQTLDVVHLVDEGKCLRGTRRVCGFC